MKKNQIFLHFFFLLSAGSISAQQLSPSVVSTSGGFYSNASGMLSFTTGEMAAVETYTSPANILTQGFQQAWDLGTYVIEHPRVVFTYGIYPNPSDGNITLLTESEVNVDLSVRIADLLGRPVMQTELSHQQNHQVHPLDLTNIPTGIYLFTLTVKTPDLIEAEQTVKIEIVR